MPGTGLSQHRGASVPNANELLKRIQNLETLLGLQGATAQAFFQVLDPNAITHARIGALLNGDYGIQLMDALGNFQEALPFVSGYEDGTLTTTSNTFVSLADFGTLDVEIGASGDCVITVCCGIEVVTAGTFGIVQLVVNGVGFENWLVGSDNAVGYAQHVSSTRQYSLVANALSLQANTLQSGVNTFSLLYRGSTNGDTYNFNHISMIVQPI